MSADLRNHGPSPAEQILATYFEAKDGNRPHLLARVFCADAHLEVHNATAAIAFPAVTQGREAVADVLVRNFARDNENVYSFYLSSPPQGAIDQFSSTWLVGMTEKSSRSVRVGCGTYRWTFSHDPVPCATALAISIDVMQILPQAQGPRVFSWLEGLAYPWSSIAAAMGSAPAIEGLQPVLDYLKAAQV